MQALPALENPLKALLALPCITLVVACAQASSAPVAASAPAASAPAPRVAARAGCATASAPPTGRATSKTRHAPDENDPCQDSRGIAPALLR